MGVTVGEAVATAVGIGVGAWLFSCGQLQLQVHVGGGVVVWGRHCQYQGLPTSVHAQPEGQHPIDQGALAQVLPAGQLLTPPHCPYSLRSGPSQVLEHGVEGVATGVVGG